MAQATDYSLANQSGSAFRTELNSILSAVQTLNSGSTAPSNLVAHMVFLDTSTTPATLKIRNAANDGFITLGTASTNFGLVSASGATFTGDITLNAQSDVRFADSDSSNYIALQAPATVASNVTFTLPSADGTANQALKTDASGNLGFASYLLLSETANGQTVTGGVRGNIVTLTDAANIAYDMDDGVNATVTLAGNRTLDNPSNITVGQSGSIFIVQDGTGSRTLSFGNAFDFAGGTAPTLTTTASAVDRIDYVVRTTSSIHCNFVANFS
nr:fiber protein [uncultured Mediterranean phage uvMED]